MTSAEKIIHEYSSLRPYTFFMTVGSLSFAFGAAGAVGFTGYGMDVSAATQAGSGFVMLFGTFLMVLGAKLANDYAIAIQAHQRDVADREGGKKLSSSVEFCLECKAKMMEYFSNV